ncbi:MAG: hypothetical protein NTY69_01220 [Methylococcales bacterium]|nr:hypothetical protein [Methylococcales bacterium]
MCNPILKSVLSINIALLISISVNAEVSTGIRGPIGLIGPKGDTGLQGAQGDVGKVGPIGQKGITGLKGDKGLHGDVGDKGLTGPKGKRGDLGPTGDSRGLQGPEGILGLKGKKGDKGDVGGYGVQGIKGDKGALGYIPGGANIGDMQYWDGIKWINIAAGLNNTELKICNGVPTWSVLTCPYKIGDTGPAGGTVFYLTDKTSLHGFEVAPLEDITYQIGCDGKLFSTFPQNEYVGTGEHNTLEIIYWCPESYFAAKIAHDYTLNGFSDWFLPSVMELKLLIDQKKSIGVFYDGIYLSSTLLDYYGARSYSSYAYSYGLRAGKRTDNGYIAKIRAF